MKRFSEGFLLECKEQLLQSKMNLLNQFQESRIKLNIYLDERGGDEIDQSLRAITEKEVHTNQLRIRTTLMEIEYALARIEGGTFGYCEETEEPIEKERLKAIPWTRLSIEGAEIRESYTKKYNKRRPF